MKRSNRLIILIGILLAVVAFVGVLILGSGGGGTGGGGATPPPTVKVVTSKVDIALGTVVSADMLSTKDENSDLVPVNAVTEPKSIVGVPVRQTVYAGQVMQTSMFSAAGVSSSVEILKNLEPGFRAMAVQVDQVTGVGTIIQPGDRVDVVIAFEDTDAKFPVVAEGPTTREGVPLQDVRNFKVIDDTLNNTSIKVLVQNSKVLGTLLPPPPEQTGQQASPAPESSSGEVALTGQQQIVILQLTAQQVELVRFAQLDGNLSLVLRATGDKDAPPDVTTGITLFELVEKWGVLPGNLTIQVPPPPK
ncbi:MAG: Flp pilus assembly CpaB, pilus assembly protein CpaB [Chloroflexi bacterium CSP1-4]|nr:MAG: Flp pilus assembly CpaB, pilus assembly protein CpaB [Chloroflexi bacterium CSP1-4]